MKVFGMTSTRHSRDYTPHALETFFKHTCLESGDEFFLIDNDQSLDAEIATKFGPVTFMRNATPLSFAGNANQILRIAKDRGANYFFLNNDLIFTPNWLSPFHSDAPLIRSPLSNREVLYKVNNFEFGPVLDLSHYLSHKTELETLGALHRQRASGAKSVFTLPFFCVNLPPSVYNVVGEFDESFGKGGAEDNDYCLRTRMAGLDVKFQFESYVLHFNGKSTWAGAETKEETEARNRKYAEVFTKKWGEALTRISIAYDTKIIQERDDLIQAAARGDLNYVVRSLYSLHWAARS